MVRDFLLPGWQVPVPVTLPEKPRQRRISDADSDRDADAATDVGSGCGDRIGEPGPCSALPLPAEVVLRDHVVEALAGDLQRLHDLRFVPAALLERVLEHDPLALTDDLVEGFTAGYVEHDL